VTTATALPPALAAYYESLDAGRADDAVACFSPDAVYAVPRRGAAETSARRVLTGRDELRAYVLARGHRPCRHEVLVAVVDGDTCLLEGVVRDAGTGAAVNSYAASARVDGDGLVRRYEAFMAPVIEPAPSASDQPAAGDARLVVDRYFEHLDAGEFGNAASCFSTSVLYSHPPYRHTGIDGDTRVEFRGRAQLLDAFRARGRRSFTHRILRWAQDGRNCVFEGVVEGLPSGGTGSFISSLTVDGAGLIDRYASFYCEPSVPF